MVLHHGKFGNRKLSIYEKNILVTGATGLLGNHFSDHLSKTIVTLKRLHLMMNMFLLTKIFILKLI